MSKDSEEIRKQINELEQYSELRLISESSLNRILTSHYNNGFIIITSYRSDDEKTVEQKNKDFNELKLIVKRNVFSFVPVYGGYIENKGEPNEKEVREPALLIPNQDISSSKPYIDDKKLYDLGIELANRFNQESFLYKPLSNENKAYLSYINRALFFSLR